jgi:Uma2 family endonuclease
MPASFEPVPPRGEDLPCDDGEPMETERHRAQMNLLIDTLRESWRDRADIYVAGNMAIYFSETQARRNDFRAPDFFVVLDTERRERKRWVVWEEEGRTPDVIVEITSESTEHVDRGTKMAIYARVLRVPFYAIFDPFLSRLDAFRLDAAHRSYLPIDRDERGYCWCEPLGLWLGVVEGVWKEVEAPWLRWIDSQGSILLADGERAVREAERAAREAERATLEAERANRAEAELERLRDELKRRGGA